VSAHSTPSKTRAPSGHGHGPGAGRAGKGGRDLTSGPVRGQFLNLTAFMAIGAIMSMTFQVVDTYFVAQLGTEELAAMAFTFPVVMILHAIAVGLGTGVTAVVSRVVGSGAGTESKVIASDSLILSIIITLLFTIAGLLTIDPLFALLGAGPEVMPLIHDYMEIWYYGMVFMIVPMIANALIRAHGDAKVPSMIMSVSAVVNLILDPILIFGLLGAPRMELQGAALATVIARFLSFAAAMWVLHHRMHALNYDIPGVERLRENWGKILHIGLPSTGTQLIVPVSMGILTALVASFGAVAVAAYGIATRVEMFALIFMMATSIAMGPFVGQNAGAGRIDRVKEAVRFALQANFVYGLLLAVILAVFGDSVAQIFSDDSEVIRVAAFYMLVVPVTSPILAIINIGSQTFNSLARPMPAMVIGAMKSMFVQVPLAYLGASVAGIQGVFVAMAVSSVIVAIVAFFWLKRVIRQEEGVSDETSAPQTSPAE
jgi:putative MATE family efflux protein